MASNNPPPGSTGPVTLAIEYHVPEGMVSRYSNQMVVQVGEHECYISFFEAQIPLLIQPTPEEVAKIKSVRATCVARVVVPLGAMPQFIKALQTTLEQAAAKERPTQPQSNSGQQGEG